MTDLNSTAELERYLHQRIPLTRAMQVSVLSISPQGILLSAPLAPNINHRETAFGGSISALATLAAWSLVHTRLVSSGLESRLVIQRNTMEFEAPVCDGFTALSSLASEDEWPRFLRMLERRGRGRVTVHAELRCAGEIAGRFEGDFVALGRD